MPKQLRDLFAYICILAVPPNAAQLFTKYKEDLYADIARNHVGHIEIFEDCANIALQDIQNILKMWGKNTLISVYLILK